MSGVSSRYEPRASLSGSLNYRVGNSSDSPEALAQVLVGIVDSYGKAYDVTCIYDGNPRTCPDSTTGSGSFKLTVPDSPGSYRLIAAADWEYSCSDARSNFPNQGDKETLVTFDVIRTDSSSSDCYWPASMAITTNVSPVGSGKITVSPDKVLMPSLCCSTKVQASCTIVTSLTLIANPASGWIFDHWEGDAYGTNPSTQVSVGTSGKSHANVTAVFKQRNNPPTSCNGEWSVWGLRGVSARYEPGAPLSGSLNYRVSNSSDSPGALAQILVGIVDSSGKAYDVTCIYDGKPRTCPDYTSGSGSFKLTVPDNPGSYRLIAAVDWQYSCSDARSNFPRQGEKETLATIEVGNKEATKYILTIEDHIGDKVLKSSTFTYKAGETAAITANSYSNYEFDHWGGAASGYNRKTSVTMDSNKTAIAYFKATGKNEDITLTIDVIGNGTTDPAAGIHSYKKGDRVTIKAIEPKDGEFIEWKGSISGKSRSITSTMNSSKKVTAYFRDRSTFTWSGYLWTKRNSTGREGPENNLFNAKNVRVDERDDTLHLKICKESNGDWSCAEVTMADEKGNQKLYGYGTYEFEVSSSLNNLDKNVVLGLFNYPEDAIKDDGTNEIDFEFSKWGDNATKMNGQLVVYPAHLILGYKNWLWPYPVPNTKPSKHIFTWGSEKVEFTSNFGSNTISKTYAPKDFNDRIPKGQLCVHLNLWLIEPANIPDNKKEVEIVIKSFKFAGLDNSHSQIKLPESTLRGMNYAGYNNYAWNDNDNKLDSVFNDMKNKGVEWIAVVPTWYQSNSTTVDINNKDPRTPTNDAVTNFIGRAKQKGFKIMLKPHVDCSNDDSRTIINPRDYKSWFANYKKMLNVYLQIAEDQNVDMFCVGTELTQLQQYKDDWLDVIKFCRDHYKGKLVYAANWDGYYKLDKKVWESLDYIGIDAYFPDVKGTTDDIDNITKKWVNRGIFGIGKGILPSIEEWRKNNNISGKPLIFTEAGFEATSNKYRDTAYSALFKSISQYKAGTQPLVSGVFIWWWDNASTRNNEWNLYDSNGKPTPSLNIIEAAYK